MNLDFVKGFLKVDFDDDDNFINLLMEVAKEYVVGAIGYCDESKARVRILELVIIDELYHKRELTVEKAGTQAQYTIRSIINQLSFEED